MEVRQSFERNALNTIRIYKIRPVNNYGMLKNDAGLNSECVVTCNCEGVRRDFPVENVCLPPKLKHCYIRRSLKVSLTGSV